MRALLLLQASREARRRVTGELSKVSKAAAIDSQRRSFAAAPVKANAATPKQREVRGGKKLEAASDVAVKTEGLQNQCRGCSTSWASNSVAPMPPYCCRD